MDLMELLFVCLTVSILLYAVADRKRLGRRGARRFSSRDPFFTPDLDERLLRRPVKRRPVSFQPEEEKVPLYSHRKHFESSTCEVCARQPRMRFEDEQARIFEFCGLHGDEKRESLENSGFILSLDTR